ncbi:MAG: sugar-binding protein, partial [Alphaproteobacteria bacterium]|nr:sugar-binding protein [Alphaproteobacteria bacterium]
DKASGFHNHHAVLDMWAHKNIPGYVRRSANSPAIRLSIAHHELTFSVYNAGLMKTGRRLNKSIDWTKVTPREILELSERQLDAAGAPWSARAEYYKRFNDYIYRLRDGSK